MKNNNMSPENNKKETVEIKIEEVVESKFPQEIYKEIPVVKFEISEEKLKNWLRENIKKLENKRAWIPSFCLLMPLIFNFITSSFRVILGLSSDFWRILYILAIIVVSIWSIKSLLKLCNSITLEEMIDNLKKDMHKFTYYRRFE